MKWKKTLHVFLDISFYLYLSTSVASIWAHVQCETLTFLQENQFNDGKNSINMINIDYTTLYNNII